MAKIKYIVLHIAPKMSIRLDRRHIITRDNKILRIYNPITGEWIPYRAIAHMIETQ